MTGRSELAGQRGDVLVLDADVHHPPAGDGDLHAHACRRAPRPTTTSAPAPPCPPARPAGRWSTSSRRPPPARRGSVSGRHSTDSVCAGRPFFIRIGVSQASEAPAANSASRTPGHSRGSRSSTLASSTTGPAGAGVGRLAQHQADDVRQLDRVAAAGAHADALDPHRRAASSTRPPARPPGPRRWGCTSRPAPAPATTGMPASSSSTAGPGIGTTPCAPRAEPLPSATGEAVSRESPRCANPATTPDDVGQRVERAHLVEVHVLGRHPVHAALGDGQPLEHRQRAVAHGGWRARRRGAARGRRPRSGACEDSGACTCTRVAPSPCRVTCSVTSRICSTGSAATAAAGTSSGTPASTSAPSSMSPDAPAERSSQPMSCGDHRQPRRVEHRRWLGAACPAGVACAARR